MFDRFGGHSHAVGCALPAERIPELRSRLDAYARQRLTPEDFVPVLEYDAEIGLDEVTNDFWLALQKLEPFGAGNPVRAVRGQEFQAGSAGSHAEGKAHQAASGAR